MQHTIKFVKASGAGNDFVLVDNWDGSLVANQAGLAMALSSRHFGVGADGLLVLEKSPRADFQMRYYNADGSYGGMCGNGGRCIAMYAYLRGLVSSPMTFEALDHVYSARVEQDQVVLRMKRPLDLRTDVKLEVSGVPHVVHYVNTGSPHVVFIVDDLESIDVTGIGRAVRNHSAFAPAGTNVNFVRIEAKDAIRIRTYERGVEEETLACGTGSVASAVVAHLLKGLHRPVHVCVRGGEELLVHLESANGEITETSLEGSAHMLFSGQALYDDLSRKVSVSIRPSH